VQSLHGQDFTPPGPPGFENSLPAAGRHARPEAMHPRPAAAFGLISSFGHDGKTSVSDVLVKEKLYL